MSDSIGAGGIFKMVVPVPSVVSEDSEVAAPVPFLLSLP